MAVHVTPFLCAIGPLFRLLNSIRRTLDTGWLFFMVGNSILRSYFTPLLMHFTDCKLQDD
ncbi:hypothetical protein ACTXT7_000541 [Hymenolepis weldensis]